MKKALLLVDQNEKIKDVIARMNVVIKETDTIINEAKKNHREKMKRLWEEIAVEMDSLGLIKKDEDGDYPNLGVSNNDQVIYTTEGEDDEHPLKGLEKALKSIFE